MSDLRIQIEDSRTAFSPGDTVAGTASWQLAERPETAELHFIWRTWGKGTGDVEIVETVAFSDPQARDSRPFRLLPTASPYSFSGQLISLGWTLELHLDPGDHFVAEEIVLAPGGQEVRLPRISKTT